MYTAQYRIVQSIACSVHSNQHRNKCEKSNSASLKACNYVEIRSFLVFMQNVARYTVSRHHNIK